MAIHHRFRPLTILPLRSSPAVWSFPLIVAAIIYGWVSILSSIDLQPYLSGYLSRAGIGLIYGLPLAAAAAAWAARRSRILHSPNELRTRVRGSLRIWWANVWPIFAAVGVGYAVTLWISLAGIWPPGKLNLSILLVYLSMTIVSVSAGWILGAILPVAIAVPLAIVLQMQWSFGSLADSNDISWRNITGFATYMCCDFVEHTLDSRAVLAPLLIAVVGLALAILSIRVPRIKLALLATVCVVAIGFFANSLVADTSPMATGLRSSGEQLCGGEQPMVCLLPEMSDEERSFVTSTLNSAYRNTEQNGLMFPREVRAPSADIPGGRDIVILEISGGESRDELLTRFGNNMYKSVTCNPSVPDPDSEFQEDEILPYALALAFGADSEEALPRWAFVEGDEGGVDQMARPIPADELKSLLGINTLDDATDAVERWYEKQAKCGG